MADAHADPVRAHAAALEQRDARLATEIDRVSGLARRVESVRQRTTGVAAFLAAFPEEMANAARLRDGTRAELDTATGELEDARRAVAALEGKRRKQDALDQAQRELRRAGDQVVDAAARLERAEEGVALLSDGERQRRAEADELVAEAPSIAAEIARIPRISASGRSAPGRDLEGLVDWCARARAALFVVRGTLVAERERLLAEANALGATVLGEELTGASVTQVRQRIENALRR